jgi:UDP-glucose 4-epimerase
MPRKILITGGAGFIGSTIADAFLGDGWEVAVIDDLSSGRRANLDPRVRLTVCDVRSPEAAAAIQAERPEVLCHQAAQIDVRKSVTDPRFDCDVNLGGLLNVMEAARLAGSVRQVLFASSGGARYGDTDVIPTPEWHPANPISHYGAAKCASELYLGVYASLYGLKPAVLRYANVYGPRQNPHGEAGVVAIFAARLLDGRPCTIYGDGCQTRDYVFVEDVARANLLAAQRGFSGAVNVGTGLETDVNQVFEVMAAAAGVRASPQFAPGRAGEQKRSCIDPARAAELLGWGPRVELADGLARTVEYFRAARRAAARAAAPAPGAVPVPA